MKERYLSMTASKRKRTVNTLPYGSSEESDASDYVAPLTTAVKKKYSQFIVLERRRLTKHDKAISALNDRALEVFCKNGKKFFVRIISKTTALYVCDDAVRLATEVGWIDVAERLLIGETSDVYENPVWPAPPSHAFVQLGNNCTVSDSKGRCLLQAAVLSAVKDSREAIFNIGVTNTTKSYCRQVCVNQSTFPESHALM